MLGNAYKPYPCGIVIHSAIDACLELVRKHKPNPDEIAEVSFDVTPGALALCWRKLPNSELEAQVGLYHWLAATLIHGEATVTQAQLVCIRGTPCATCSRGSPRSLSRARDGSGQGRDAHA